jgi:hypothetical protein
MDKEWHYINSFRRLNSCICLLKRDTVPVLRANHRRRAISNYDHKLNWFHMMLQKEIRPFCVTFHWMENCKFFKHFKTMSYDACKYTHFRRSRDVRWLINSQWIVNTLVEYVWRVHFQYLYSPPIHLCTVIQFKLTASNFELMEFVQRSIK